MNVQPRKLGSLALIASAALTFALYVSTARAQEADQQVEGWHDRLTSDEPTARAAEPSRPSEPADERPVRPAESPRAGSSGYSPNYQQSQSDRPRTNYDRPAQNYDRPTQNYNRPAQNYNRAPQNYDRMPQNYRQPNPNDRAPRYYSQYNAPMRDPRQPVRQASDGRSYYDGPQGRAAGPYYGYPSTNARPVSYRRQEVEFVDDQPHSGPMAGQPSLTVETPGPQGSQMMGPPMGSPQGEWGGPDGGCGCADGNCPSCGCADGSCEGGCGCDSWPRNSWKAFGDWCRQDAFRDLSLYAGVQGFKDPTDLGENGDFGFHEGANWGLPLWGCSGVGFQIGGEIDHSDLAPNATVFGDHRNQFFVTSGVFYRPTRECGWQGGVVFDYLDDQFYDSVVVGQIRGNLSYAVDLSEFGFEFSASTHDDKIAPAAGIAAFPTVEYNPVDLYTLYYGRRLKNGGQVKAFAGLANGLGAIVGADLDIAISDSFSLEGDFSYVIADKAPTGDVPGESANIAFSLVWHPGCHARDTFDSAYRPLFNVADNSSLIVNRH